MCNNSYQLLKVEMTCGVNISNITTGPPLVTHASIVKNRTNAGTFRLLKGVFSFLEVYFFQTLSIIR